MRLFFKFRTNLNFGNLCSVNNNFVQIVEIINYYVILNIVCSAWLHWDFSRICLPALNFKSTSIPEAI